MPDGAITDTSALQYLHQAGQLWLLPKIYASITVPMAVADEIRVGKSQGVSLPDLEHLDWIEIEQAPHLEILPLVVDLGRGEREVLSLAVSRPGSLAILDDALARHFAEILQVKFTGTLGVLLKAKRLGYVDRIGPLLSILEELGFRLDEGTRNAVLRLAEEPAGEGTGS